MAQFTNQAQLSYNNTVLNSNIATGELLDVLSVTKTAVTENYDRSGNAVYVVSIVNTGNTAYTGLTLTDNLGGYTFGTATVYPLRYVEGSVKYYNNGILQTAAPTVTAGPPLVITGITVPAGGNATVIYEADITGFAPLGTESQINNTVTLSGNGITALTATETITAAAAPELTINKTISPASVTEGDRVTYTFTILNYGNTAATAADNVVIRDTFNPILSSLAVTFNGTAWAATTNYTYNQSSGEFATVAGQITVPAATYAQNTDGSYAITPGVSVLTVTGTV